MKLAVAIATYQRENGKTPFFLKRALDSVFAQKHKDFKVFVVGDRYKKLAELKEILSKYPKNKIKSVNLKVAVEQEKYKGDKKKLWHSGGVCAFNVAIDMALKDGFEYICHLDDDDYWKTNHLFLINQVLEETHADWICTKVSHSIGDLPPIESTEFLVPYLPTPCKVINSSTCFNHKTLPFQYKDIGDKPSDADLWERIRQYMGRNPELKSYCINSETCLYQEDGKMMIIEREEKKKRIKIKKRSVEVSVCCLTYNQEDMIRDAVEGFLMQKTNFSYEIVIYDDASTDSNQEIIKEYAKKYPDLIKAFYGKENQFQKTGLYPFPTHLYPRARGNFIAECDGDDYWTDPLKLQKQYDFMQEHPECSLCYHRYLFLENGLFRELPNVKPPDYTQDELIGYTPQGYGIHTSTKFWRNYFNEDTREDFENFRADYATTVLLGTFGGCKFVPEVGPSVFRYRHPKSSWCLLPYEEIKKKTEKLYKDIYGLMVEKGNLDWVRLREPFLHVYEKERKKRETQLQTKKPYSTTIERNKKQETSPKPHPGHDRRARTMPANWR